MPNSHRPESYPNDGDGDGYVVQIHRVTGDSWHRFTTMEEAAAYALDLLQSVVDSKTYPAAIWHEHRKLWKPFGRHGKLHIASTSDALASLARRTR